MLVANVSLQGSSGGVSHACAILEGSSLKCWGLNGNGQLGLGDTLNRGKDSGEMGNLLPSVDLGTGRTASQVAVGGAAQTCVIMDNAQVKCWGLNTNGQLGLGDKTQRGSAVGQMGNSLPQVLTILPYPVIAGFILLHRRPSFH
jgi:alpha-tubulin suppressor-like RCC1 family protein